MSTLTLTGAGPEVAGAAAPFDPLSLSPSAWFKADAGTSTTTDGVAISQWNDQSGNARHLTQATGTRQPLFKAAASGINSLPIVRFDGVDDLLLFNAGSAFITSSALTAFVSFRIVGSGAGTDGRIFSTGNTAPVDFSVTNAVDLFETSNGNTAGPYTITQFFNSVAHSAATQVAANTAWSLSTVYDGANGSLFRNGIQDPAASWAAVPGPFAIQFLSVGGSPLGTVTDSCKVDVGEALIYPTALSVANRQNVEGYMRSRWGTP